MASGFAMLKKTGLESEMSEIAFDFFHTVICQVMTNKQKMKEVQCKHFRE
jgi:hypothetical protein